MSIYDFKIKRSSDQEFDLHDLKGKVLLIVNTATGCGFTPQYKGLQELYDRYKENGFEILDFPCNSFLFQAPGSDDRIDGFCTAKYHTTFERFTKIKVNGKDANEVYKYLTSKESGFKGKIRWNFTKFLIDRDGKVVNRFAPKIKPETFDAEISKLVLGE